MDLLDWIAASKRMEFVTPLEGDEFRAYFARFKPRGFLADFVERPIVAEENGTKLTLSRKSSFFGRSGSIRCVVEVERIEIGNVLHVRLWHGPLLTAWFCFSYAMAFVLIFAGLVAAIRGLQVASSIAAGITGLLVASLWVVITRVFNAYFRAQKKAAIDELVAVFTTLKTAEFNAAK